MSSSAPGDGLKTPSLRSIKATCFSPASCGVSDVATWELRGKDCKEVCGSPPFALLPPFSPSQAPSRRARLHDVELPSEGLLGANTPFLGSAATQDTFDHACGFTWQSCSWPQMTSRRDRKPWVGPDLLFPGTPCQIQEGGEHLLMDAPRRAFWGHKKGQQQKLPCLEARALCLARPLCFPCAWRPNGSSWAPPSRKGQARKSC